MCCAIAILFLHKYKIFVKIIDLCQIKANESIINGQTFKSYHNESGQP